MRNLDKRAIMTGDFLLVSGDVVSNISLAPALARHRARREKDKNAIMTMVLREAGTHHRTKSSGRRPLFVIDPDAERCLHYEEMGRRTNHSRRLQIDPQLLASHRELEVRTDLIDCYIDICTPEALSLWSDNFDYQSLRQSYLAEVLKDYELTGKTIHTYIATEDYAARVQSLRAYDAVSKDVMSRWTYPLCPDSNLIRGQSYRFGRGKIYEEDGVTLSRTSVVKSKCVLGQDTSLADGSIVSDSILGRRCAIGKNVIIEESYLWNDVVVGDGSVVQRAVIADGVVIGKNCTIRPGALVSFGVELSDGTTVDGTSKLTRGSIPNRPEDRPPGVNKEDGYSSSADPGDDDSETSSTASSHLLYRIPSASNSDSSVSTWASQGEEDEVPFDTSSRRSSFHSDSLDDRAKNRDFHVEAVASVFDGLQKGDLSENILLELNSYRMAVDANQHEVRHAVVAALIKRIFNLVGSDAKSQVALLEAVKEVFGSYKSLIEKIIFDRSADQKTDQVDFLLLVQEEAVGKTMGDSLMLFVAKEAYFLEIVEEDGVFQWWDDDRSQTKELASVRGLTEQFITFLQEAEEESSEDESGDE
jgi:translation initiation factor eIF-2B subunit epsilon